MAIYDLTLRKEVLLELAADAQGDLSRAMRMAGDSPAADIYSKLYTLMYKARCDVLSAQTDDDLFRAQGKFNLVVDLLKEKEKPNDEP